MNTKSPIARAILVSAAAATALACVSPAFAQSPDAGPPAPPAPRSAPPPGPDNPYACAKDEANHTAAGGVIGLTAGAVAGSNLAGRYNRTGGALVGGLLGAVVGSAIGRSTADCVGPPPPPPAVVYRPYPVRHYYRYYGGYYYGAPVYGGPVYVGAPPPPPPPPPPGYYDNGPPPGPGASNDGCQNVEGRVQLPDGRTQSRMVKTCPDANGDYQIVN